MISSAFLHTSLLLLSMKRCYVHYHRRIDILFYWPKALEKSRKKWLETLKEWGDIPENAGEKKVKEWKSRKGSKTEWKWCIFTCTCVNDYVYVCVYVVVLVVVERIIETESEWREGWKRRDKCFDFMAPYIRPHVQTFFS